MLPRERTSRLIMPALLVLVALRALVPMGYMPASPGSGLLFEVCHDGMPLSIAAPSSHVGGHAQSADHGAHHHEAGGDDHAMAADGCALGHILSVAFLDSFDSAAVTIEPPVAFDTPEPATHLLPSRRLTPAPRGPPLV